LRPDACSSPHRHQIPSSPSCEMPRLECACSSTRRRSGSTAAAPSGTWLIRPCSRWPLRPYPTLREPQKPGGTVAALLPLLPPWTWPHQAGTLSRGGARRAGVGQHCGQAHRAEVTPPLGRGLIRLASWLARGGVTGSGRETWTCPQIAGPRSSTESSGTYGSTWLSVQRLVFSV
jgi:hypothetical protein